ncbi:MFS transporter [Klebsiella sp. DNRA6]|uniref:MFS transporter n=1 Tax=Klebsiella sp. DNRA6 TaxID=2723057 RepID=UPI0014729FFF|nr:MFS transporter [Klebsiella sp. DNRA6]NMD81424.1 MFS transporter [Klebsiella sp. DNRA6]
MPKHNNIFFFDGRLLSNILCIWLPSLLSTISTALLLLGFSFDTYIRSGSALCSSSAFVTQWFFPILFVGLVGYITSYPHTKRILILVELFQFLIIIPLLFLNLPGALFIFFIRGILDNCSKTARAVIVKDIVPRNMQEVTFTFINSALYIGFSLAGLITWLGMNYNGLQALVYFALLSHLANIFFYLILPSTSHESDFHKKDNKYSHFRGVKALYNDKRIFSSFILLIIITSFLQGFHSVARVALPSLFEDASLSDVSLLQTSIGPIILGALVTYSFLRKKKVNAKKILYFSIMLSVIFLFILSFVESKKIGFIFYLIYFFFFEISYTLLNNDIVVNCKKEESSYIISSVQALVLSSLAIVTLLLGGVSDLLSITISLYLCMLVITVSLIIYFILNRNIIME